MKQLLITIAALVVVGCGESQQSATAPEAMLEPPHDISLFHAAYSGNIEAVKLAIADGANVNSKTQLGQPPLHAAALQNHKEIVELLIVEGANVNAKSANATPLKNAVVLGNKEVVEVLIANGADLNVKDDFGLTPLDYLNTRDYAEQVIDEDSSLPKAKAASTEIADLLRKHGGKTGEELKAEEK